MRLYAQNFQPIDPCAFNTGARRKYFRSNNQQIHSSSSKRLVQNIFSSPSTVTSFLDWCHTSSENYDDIATVNVTNVFGNNNKTNNKRGVNTAQVRSIMSILEERYDLPLPLPPLRTPPASPLLSDADITETCDDDDDDDNKNKNNNKRRKVNNEWKKTRNYLYHANRSHQPSQQGSHDGGDIDDDDSGGGDGTLTLQQQVITVLDFLDERLDLPSHVSKKILQDSPRILRKPVSSFLVPTSDFLLELWGRDLFLQAVERNPALLLSSGVGYTTNRKKKKKNGNINENSDNDNDNDSDSDNDSFYSRSSDDTDIVIEKVGKAKESLEVVEEILSKYTGLSSSAAKRIKISSPFVFGLAPSQLHSVLGYLESILSNQKEVDTTTTTTATTTMTVIDEELLPKSKKILGKIIMARPNLLNLSVEKNLKPRMEFLTTACDLNVVQLAKVVQTSNGSVLSLSVEQNLKPTMDFMWHEIFYDHERNKNDQKILLKKCLSSHPQILGLSLTNLKSKVEYFNSIGPSLAVRIAAKCPAIYSLNLEQNIIPTIDFLANIWGMTTNETTQQPSSTKEGYITNNKRYNSNSIFLQNMLHEYPNIITLSVEANIRPTMMFFNKTGYTLLNENWELISSDLIGENSPQLGGNNNNGDHSSHDIEVGSKTISSNRIRGRYIAASLYNRLLPRWHFCLSSSSNNNFDSNSNSILVDKNVTALPGSTATTSSSSSSAAAESTKKIQQPKIPPLHLLVMSSDEAFCETMGFRFDFLVNSIFG
ncbi:hypothetical protein FRACYDRAFT_234489 [Fragilariopsis cylindrus CCMP1102]|uniref:Uncharacterized protein n=1 Tax=Fragilariopsis cylindrus CCMP1102 TaxID=635003 RepID=A0A1E7FRU0_9STRA|nr:hypothetical protein FRACYDRAFT_234489 [Fragilariopsis cylindrus CCMP1102]|eukprot:OEU20858.1 hypothetical protein FRACYDRAFT_234489 [Fragilariopsis cylindrus CCMP1102]